VTMTNVDTLTPEAKRDVLQKVLKTLESKFYKPELLGTAWKEAVSSRRDAIEAAPTADAFEQGVTELLQTLKTSHLGFFHGAARRASSRAALSATYLSVDTPMYGLRWVFQDVHEGGAAAIGGVNPGDILLAVDGKDLAPPEHPVFPMGATSEMTIVGSDGAQRNVRLSVARPKGKKLQYVEPTLVISKNISPGIGYLKVAMFPGMVGVDVANAMSTAIAELGAVKGLIVDLRGNTGGGAGSLRLMSLLTPAKIPVGFAADKKWAERDLASLKQSFPRFDKIPKSSQLLWLLALKYLPTLITKAPVVLESEGLGDKPYHGRIILLVDRHTASAAEMVTIFAKENCLATIVGEPTAGRLLSATSAKVGYGFRLALPTGAYYTWNGTALEGLPIDPDHLVEFSWTQRREGTDAQLTKALELLSD
jgi:carboxyl-terminal processing protease